MKIWDKLIIIELFNYFISKKGYRKRSRGHIFLKLLLVWVSNILIIALRSSKNLKIKFLGVPESVVLAVELVVTLEYDCYCFWFEIRVI
jgi:hypothetical protein